MSEHINWVPEWARGFTIACSTPAMTKIQFYADLGSPTPTGARIHPIEDLPHVLAVRNIPRPGPCQKMRDKPLSDGA